MWRLHPAAFLIRSRTITSHVTETLSSFRVLTNASPARSTVKSDLICNNVVCRYYYSTTILKDQSPLETGSQCDDLGFLRKDVDSLLALCKISEKQLFDIRVALVELGLEPKRVVNMLKCCPEISKLNVNHVKHQYNSLQVLHLSQKEVKDVIEKYPLILHVSTPRLRAIGSLLSAHFRDRELGKILTSMPEILCESLDSLEAKIKYCTEDMGLTLSVAAKSKILTCDLDTLKIRHTFLKKAGLYVEPSSVPVGSSIQNCKGASNPPVSKIMLTSDNDFIRLYPGLSEEELCVFQQMYVSELDESSDLESFSEDEDQALLENDPDREFSARRPK